MSKKQNDTGPKKIRVHVWMFEEDVELLQTTYEQTIGFSGAVRTVMRGFCNEIREKIRQTEKTPEPTEAIPNDTRTEILPGELATASGEL